MSDFLLAETGHPLLVNAATNLFINKIIGVAGATGSNSSKKKDRYPRWAIVDGVAVKVNNRTEEIALQKTAPVESIEATKKQAMSKATIATPTVRKYDYLEDYKTEPKPAKYRIKISGR